MKETQLTDEELLVQMEEGHEEAFCQLYERRRGPIFAFALQMSGSRATAEEVTQDVFMTLIENHHKFDPERGRLLSYLYGVARNKLRRRRDGKLNTAGEDILKELAGAGPDLEERLTVRLEVQRLRRVVTGLPPRYREVIVLCDLNGHSYQEAAEILGCSIGTVRSRLHRGREHLRNKLDETRESQSLPCSAASVRGLL